jgi:hypothetical protein
MSPRCKDEDAVHKPLERSERRNVPGTTPAQKMDYCQWKNTLQANNKLCQYLGINNNIGTCRHHIRCLENLESLIAV